MRRVVQVLLLTLPAFFVTSTAFAQSPSPAPGTDIFGNMPGVVIVLIPVVLLAALYLSYRLGSAEKDDGANRREGAVSRALKKGKT